MTTSSHCSWGDCVHVEPLTGGVIVGHHNGQGKQLVFTEGEWTAFINGVKDGEFDLERLQP